MNIFGAVSHFLPRYCRQGDRGPPRSWRALKRWRKLCPGRSRTAEPMAVWCAMSNALTRAGDQGMGLFLMLRVSTCVREGQLMRLQGKYIVGPHASTLLVDPEEEERFGKTGDYDLSVVLDNTWLTWTGPALRVLTRRRDEPVWPFGYPQCAHMFKKPKPEPRTAFGPEKVPIDRATKFRSPGRSQTPRWLETRPECGPVREREPTGVQCSATPNYVDLARRRMRETTQGFFDRPTNSCASHGPW